MKFSAAHLLAGLLALGGLYFAASRSALCILRRRTDLPPAAAKTVGSILAAAFFVIYLSAAAVLSLVFASRSTELVRAALLSQPESQPEQPAAAQDTSAPGQGTIAAEQERTERQRLIAETTQQQIRAAAERRQLFGQEQGYVVPEGISGTEDRYLPPKPEAFKNDAVPSAEPAETETKISVQDIISSSDDIASVLDSRPQQPVQEVPQTQQQAASAAAAGMDTAGSSNSIPSAAPPQPVQQFQAQPQPVQTQAEARQVPCGEIRRYMDEADGQLFHRAMQQAAGAPSLWKGPGGSYVVIPASVKGNCREYSIQANIQGRVLRCYAACAAAVPPAGNMMQPQPAGKQVILNSMSSTDQDALIKALNYHGPVSWRGLSGIFYTVFPVRLGNPCRDYMVQANIQGRIFQYLESNCQ